MKVYRLLFLLLVSHHVTLSQSLVKQPSFASPNAASLGKYADIPVSYHTGVPNISIPIYTVEVGSLSLPVNLSYHSSGIRVDEVASWVGLGWSLNAGGMISRTVQGGPDEGVVGGVSGGQSPYVGSGWYKDMGIPQAILDCSSRPLSTEGPQAGTYPSYGGCGSIYRDASEGLIDTEPDLYTFNFGEYSGKFFFDTNRNVRMIPESDLHIVPVNSPSYFYSWKIIAPDGTKYFFGGLDATEKAYSDPAELSGDKRVTASTTWYVYRIESSNGENWISFDYEGDSYSFGNRGGHTISFRESDTDNNGQPIGGRGNIVGGGLWGGSGNVNLSDLVISTTIVDARRLKQITTSSGYVTIDFLPATTAREDLTHYDKSIPTFSTETANTISKRLQHIKVSATNFCKTFELAHDYYGATDCTGCSGATWYGSNFDKKRLRLNWVQESICNGESVPKYEFFYNTQALPRRYSLARDMWGYYNGIETNTGLLETFTNPVLLNVNYTTSNYRTVDEVDAMAGILTKVKYPTGGYAEFVYEGHREAAGSALIGGLRVKQILTNDGFNNVITKNIEYPQGKLYLNPTNYQNQYPNNNDNYTQAFLGGMDFTVSHSSNPLPPMWSSQGYHIGYTKVKVIEPGNGYSIYSYLNGSPAITMPFHFPYKPSVAAIGTSDLVMESKHLNGNTNDNVFISQNTITRTNTGSTTTTNARTVQRVSCVNCSGGDTQFGIYMDYSIITHRFNITQKVEKFDNVTTTTAKTYSTTRNNPTSQQITDSKGVVRRTEWLYPGDAGTTTPAIMYDRNQADFKNMIAAFVEQKDLVGGVLKKKVTNQFTQTGTKIHLTSSKTYPTATASFVEDQYQYDENSNIVNIRRTSGDNVSYFWGYNNSHPIAEAVNASFSKTIVQENSTSPFSSGSSSGPIILTNSAYVDFSQNITIAVDLPTSGVNPPYQGSQDIDVVIRIEKNGSFVSDLTFNFTSATTHDEEVIALSSGIYTLTYLGKEHPSDPDYSFSGTFSGLSNKIRSTVFHTSFEEDALYTSSTAKTGKKSHSDAYGVPMPPVTGEYIVTYWKKPSGGVWAYYETLRTVATANDPDFIIGAPGDLIDEVRLYPRGAQMTTYTYEPAKGISSITDENNFTMHYDYDDFGRLKAVKDDNSNVIKTYSYHYKP